MSDADGWGAVRTVCHGCRTMREMIEQVGPHKFTSLTVLIPGDGTVYRRVRSVFETADAIVEALCPECSDNTEHDNTAEWLLPGLIPPA